MLGQGFDDGANIAGCKPSVSMFCRTFRMILIGTTFGNEIFHQLGASLGHMIDQLLGFFAAQQLGGMVAQDVGDMCGNDRTGIHHSVAQRPGFITQGAFNPQRWQTKGRIGGGSPWMVPSTRPRINGQILADKGFTLANFHALEHDPIFIGPDFQIIPDMHRWHQKASSGDFSYGCCAPDAILAILGNDPPGRNQPVADLQTDWIHCLHITPADPGQRGLCQLLGIGQIRPINSASAARCLLRSSAQARPASEEAISKTPRAVYWGYNGSAR